ATYVYIFIFVAVLTLLIACINFINLSTARSTNRSKEVGLRKTVGALRGHLVGQFLGEAIIISLIALSLAILIAELSSGWISRTTGIWLDIHYIQDAFVIGLLLLITLAVGLGAGLYPAFFLSRFQPVQVLRGPVKGGKKGGNLRKSLVVFQFIISTGLIIGSGVLLRQLDYIQGMDMGFDREWRVVMPVQVNPPPKRVQMVERLKREFDAYPGIVNTSASFTVPGQARNLTQVVVDGQSREEPYMPVTLGIDYNYVETMGLRIKEGRPFSTEYAADSFETVLVNEALLRELQIEDPLGKILIYPANPGFGQQEEDRVRIIGVYEDMHFEPVYREIHPMILRIIPQQYNNLFVHISPENKDQTLAYMESSWNDIVAEKPFSYRFLDEELSEIYASEHELGSLVNIFTLVAVFIACLGLFGLSAFTTQQRRKEISIRKVLGASSRDIMFLLTREFLVLVAIAIIPGALLAWYVTEVYWLETFAYKTTLGIGIFLLAGGLSLLIAFLTVSFLSFRAANANPVDALHRE
ncbi:MAG: FtsX-like permease family protein, partial [Bacteroidota bacterium]